MGTADKLTEIVKDGDVQKARALFNAKFWLNDNIVPQWNHLKLALLNENKPMMRFLINWGATCTVAEMNELREQLPEKHSHYVTLLRQCGLGKLKQTFHDAAQVAAPLAASAAKPLPPKPQPPPNRIILG
jgi:hypothetical protein